MKTGKSKSFRTKLLTLCVLFVWFVLLVSSVWASEEIIIGTGTLPWVYPLATVCHDARTQTIYLAGEIGNSYNITALALDVALVPGQTMGNFTIRMKHTDLSVYGGSPNWESSGWTTVYQTNETITATGWVQFDFTTPFEYNGTQNLMVDISFNNSYYTTDGRCRYSTPGGTRTIYYRTNSNYGDPLAWSGRTPTPSATSNVPNVKLIVELAKPVFVPDGGYYHSEQNVVITCSTPGATIHYTTNGLDPTESDPTVESGGSVLVSVEPSTTLKAKAWKTGLDPSSIKEATYLYGFIDNPSMEGNFIYQDPLGDVAEYWTGWEEDFGYFSEGAYGAHDANKSQQIYWNGYGYNSLGPDGIYQTINSLEPGQIYCLSAWFKLFFIPMYGPSGDCDITFSVGTDPSGGTNSDVVTNWVSVSDYCYGSYDGPWLNVVTYFSPTGTMATIFIKVDGYGSAWVEDPYGPEPWEAYCSIDDVVVRQIEIDPASSVEATSPVPANGAILSEITITVLDANGNPIEGIPPSEIDVNCSGSDNIIFGPDGPTDANGQIKARICSTVSETKTVSATVVGTPLSNTADIYFCKSIPCKIRASDGAAGDDFGYSVAIDGNTAVIGAYHDNDKGSESGSAYIFRYDGSSWVQEAKLVAPDGAADDWFGIAVAIDGNTAVIGAYGDDDKGIASGSAYIFRYDGSSWVQEAKLLAPDGAALDYFGDSVAIDGNTAVIGAYGDDDKGSYSGSAYIFRYNGSTWVQEAKLLAADGAASDYFGYAVAIDGNTAVIGAYGDDDKGSNSGSAYVFRFDSSSWTQEAKLLAPDGAADDCFGRSVAINGNTAVIGAYNDDDKGSNSGSAYVFRFDSSSWTQEAKLLASDGAASDYFGFSVAIDGNTALVGALYDDDKGYDSGSAYIFRYDSSSWVQEAKLVAPDGAASDCFGRSIAINGNTAVIGAYGDDDKGSDSGSAYVFPTTIPGDFDGDGSVNFFDYSLLAGQWLDLPGQPSADVAPCGGDCEVNFQDLEVLCSYWLE